MADRNLSATITIGGNVNSSLGKAFGTVSKGANSLGAQLKAISQETKDLEKMVKELKAAGKATGDLEKKLQGLYKRQAQIRGKQGRIGAVGHMLGGGGGLQFGATTSAILKKVVSSETLGPGAVKALLAAEAAIPIIGEIAIAITVLVGAALAGAAAIFALGKSAAEFIDNAADMADGLGVSTNNLLGLQYAAAQSGIDADKLNEKLGKLTLSLESARDGTGPAAEALRELGLTWQELSVMNPEEQVTAIAEAFKTYNGNIPKVSLANAFFGKGASRFVNMLNQGRDGIRGMMKDARDVGYTVSKEQEEMATRFDAAWSNVIISFKAAWLQIGTSVLPVVNAYLEQIVSWFKDPVNQQGIKNFAQDFGTLVAHLAASLPSITKMLNACLGFMNGIVAGVQTVFNLGGIKGLMGIAMANPSMLYQGVVETQASTGGAGVRKLAADAVVASAQVGHQLFYADSKGAAPAAPAAAKPSAGVNNTYHFTVNGATGQNANDLMEQIRRYMRDTQPQTVGGY